MVLVLGASKQVILLELPIAWEANDRKRAKYVELVEECQSPLR